MREASAADTGGAKVTAPLCYSVDNGRPVEYYFYEPKSGEPQNPSGTDSRVVEIEDAWPLADRLSADREGFEIKSFASPFERFEDDEAIRADFYREVIDFVRRHTGARQVAVFDHTLRKRMSRDLKDQTVIQRPAVMLVHSDYTPRSGPQRVRDVMGEEAEGLLGRRVAFYNVWKPLYETVEELPLALCDATSAEDADLVQMNLRYRERTGEILRHASQSGAPLVLFPEDASRPGCPAEDLRQRNRRPRPLRRPHCLRRPQHTAGRDQTPEHRAAHHGLLPERDDVGSKRSNV